MGVRGKIEAVLYAAEEPVTLVQLTALFGEEALAESSKPQQLELEVGDTQAVAPAEGQELSPETDLQQPSMPDDSTESTEEDLAGQASEEPRDDARQQASEARRRDRAQREAVREIVANLVEACANDTRGVEIREIAGGFRVATKPEYHDAVRTFARSLKPPMKLSLQALETLAVIAYKQPVTAPEVAEIRGVDSGGVLGSLMSRKLVTTAGRKQVLGRPILYKTTREFLLRFGLKDLNELPSMEEFERMAGELRALGEEPEAAAHEQPLDAAVQQPALLERPAEPELSIIVEAEEPQPDGGVQVLAGGAAAVDNAAAADDAAIADEGETHG